MTKQMKTWNGYEVVDDAARKDIDNLFKTIDEQQVALDSKSDFSGKYADLIDKPVIPDRTSQLQNDSKFLTEHQSLDGYAKTEDHYTKTESDNKYQPKGNYLTTIPSEYVTETELIEKGYAAQTLVDELSKTVDDLKENGTGDSSKAIIDVVELPTEDINKGIFYRLLKAHVLYSYDIQESQPCYCVDSLPEIGEVTTDVEMSFFKFYYSVQNNEVYGYVDEELASAFGFPSFGWVDYGTLCTFIDETYKGIITHIDDADDDGAYRILLSYSLHTYKDGWKELPYAYESEPTFDIVWDGDITDKFILDMSMLGYDEGVYFVKVSDDIFNHYEEIEGFCVNVAKINGGLYDTYEVGSDVTIDTWSFPGAMAVGDFIVIVHSNSELNASLGLPDGYISNGIYFLLNTAPYYNLYVSEVHSPKKATKINSKFIDTSVLDNLATVATTGYYSDLLGKPTVYEDVVRYGTSQSLSSTNKSRARANIDVYSKSEVDNKIANASGGITENKVQSMIDGSMTEVESMIAEAIGNAIGGSY